MFLFLADNYRAICCIYHFLVCVEILHKHQCMRMKTRIVSFIDNVLCTPLYVYMPFNRFEALVYIFSEFFFYFHFPLPINLPIVLKKSKWNFSIFIDTSKQLIDNVPINMLLTCYTIVKQIIKSIWHINSLNIKMLNYNTIYVLCFMNILHIWNKGVVCTLD